MWIGDVDIPSLLSAHRQDRVVLNVVAGASVAPPSGLPLPLPLTERIASKIGTTLSDAGRESPIDFSAHAPQSSSSPSY